MRARAKTINFATIYGQGAFALSRQLGISLEDARGFIARYFERFSGVRAFLDRQIELARQQGYVETLFGRRRYIPEIKERNFSLRSYGERNAQNSPLQGSAADLIKLAMVRIHDAISQGRLSGRMLLQVHDELIFEVPPEEVRGHDRARAEPYGACGGPAGSSVRKGDDAVVPIIGGRSRSAPGSSSTASSHSLSRTHSLTL